MPGYSVTTALGLATLRERRAAQEQRLHLRSVFQGIADEIGLIRIHGMHAYPLWNHELAGAIIQGKQVQS